MAGNKNSGRRGGERQADGTFSSSRFEPDPDDPAPDLDGTTEANKKFTAWVARQLTSGRMDPRTADAASGVAAKNQAAIRLEHGLHELDELRELVARQEQAIRAMRENQIKGRYEAVGGNGPALGRVRLPDGEPH